MDNKECINQILDLLRKENDEFDGKEIEQLIALGLHIRLQVLRQLKNTMSYI